MKRRMLYIQWLLSTALVMAVMIVSPSAGEDIIIRYTTYLLIETEGKSTRVAFESRTYGSLNKDYIYKDPPSFGVISAEGNILDEIDGKLGETTTVTVPASSGEFALIEARPGNNYCVARPERAYAFVATETAPLNVVKGFERLYFVVPKGLDGASIFLHAFSVGEAGRVLICDGNGKGAVETEDDFNEPTAVNFLAPQGQDGKVWSLSLVSPRNPKWKLDDCKVWLGGSLPGILSPKPEWAERLSRPFIINWRPVCGFEDQNPIAAAQYDRPPKKDIQPPMFKTSLSNEQAHRGKQSLRIEMNLGDCAAQTNVLKLFTRPLEVGDIQRVRFWLFGDGSGRKLTVRVQDQNREHHYCVVSPITWKGWGEVTADFTRGLIQTYDGDGNKRIDGPKVTVVLQIAHEPGQPTQSVYYLDDLAASP